MFHSPVQRLFQLWPARAQRIESRMIADNISVIIVSVSRFVANRTSRSYSLSSCSSRKTTHKLILHYDRVASPCTSINSLCSSSALFLSLCRSGSSSYR